MKLASVLTPLSDTNLTLAAQAGVESIALRYQDGGRGDWSQTVQRLRSYGLQPAAVEGYVPMESIICGDDGRESEIHNFLRLLEIMSEVEIPVLCYNFMPGTDWVRTRIDFPERGGAKTTQFRLGDIEDAVALNSVTTQSSGDDNLSAESLWRNLSYFLERVIPRAEELGINLAMHPDDPPLESIHNQDRIMNSVESFDRLLNIAPSPNNGICFCQATFTLISEDIIATIHRFGDAIKYVHFRDVRGSRKDFVETFHDNGPTDMLSAMLAYKKIAFDGPIRPDHVPQLIGEDAGEPGYTMMGRLFAFGYMRGLIEAADALSQR
ncbi:MAG: mannonate dehydratase [Rhizobiales bacterium]|nr:mannonate dehydratase [Hyphomicrobiales bacterium]NRB12920.1 mannonate dehydratase [Hyphomicrobiales bacterium]